MIVTETRVRLFWERAKKLPNKLSDLPPLEGKDNEITDGWNREIEYRAEGSVVILLSRGKNRKSATTNEERHDIILRFDVTKERQPKTDIGKNE
jgi:hypothetical protein